MAAKTRKMRAKVEALGSETVLLLMCMGLGDAEMEELATLAPQVQHVTDLSLYDNRIGSRGAVALCRVLGEMPVLQRLDLHDNAIGDAGVAALAGVLGQLPRLQHLNLTNNSISEEGACSLAAVLAQTSLRVLFLANNGVREKGALAITKVLAQSQLTCVDNVIPRIDHPSLAWRLTLARFGPWSEARHASFPAPIRGIIAVLLVVARSKHARTRERSLGLWDARTASLYAMFRWIGRLNYFECQP